MRQKKKNHVVMWDVLLRIASRNSIYKLKKVVDSGLAGKSVVLMWILCGGEGHCY
ncbi:MAG: hypothetical protein ACLTS6_11035 [Anaerobutyricum sp.]